MIIESLRLFYHLRCFQCCVCHVQLGSGQTGTDVRVRNNKLHCQNCYSNDEGGLKSHYKPGQGSDKSFSFFRFEVQQSVETLLPYVLKILRTPTGRCCIHSQGSSEKFPVIIKRREENIAYLYRLRTNTHRELILLPR